MQVYATRYVVQVENATSAQVFSERLIGRRNHLGLSQTELAVKVGAALRSVQHWESGSHLPHGGTLRSLAATLGVSLAWLTGDDDPERAKAAGDVVRDEVPGWQRDLGGRLSALPEWRLRRVLAAFHATLDALAEPPVSHNPELRRPVPVAAPVRYSEPVSSPPGTSMAAYAALVPAHMPPRPAASPRAAPIAASPSDSGRGRAIQPPPPNVQ